MKKIAKFEKVSLEQFKKDWIDTFGEAVSSTLSHHDSIEEIYNSINLPKRATTGSAGYDFYAPIDIDMAPNTSIKIPTGIRAKIEENWMLTCYPRSGLGFKFRLQLDNTVGIIDSDYYYSSNEGHIMIKMTNDSRNNKSVHVDKGAGFAQGIFIEYGITIDDDTTEVRDGGFGSTNK